MMEKYKLRDVSSPNKLNRDLPLIDTLLRGNRSTKPLIERDITLESRCEHIISYFLYGKIKYASEKKYRSVDLDSLIGRVVVWQVENSGLNPGVFFNKLHR